jgi:hypothetical protein
MEKQDEGVSHPLANVTTASRLRTSGALTMVGSAVRVVGAILTAFGSFVGLPAIGSLGNALSAGSGLGLLFLPIGLRASRVGDTGALANMATAALLIGICLASLADIPAILDPTDLEAGGALGPIGLVLLSAGFLLWFVAIWQACVLGDWRQYHVVVTGLWFPLTFPTVQLPLFVIPNGRPSFVLLAAASGLLQLLMEMVVRKQVGATPNPPKAP